MRKLKIIAFSILLASGLLFAAHTATAQCPMCKANVESSLKGGGKKAGMGLNSGIVALLVMPYVMVGIVGVLWYTTSRKKKLAKGQE
jgi:hypothetical protein